MDNLYKINIGGTKFLTERSTLQKYPNTLLGSLNQQSQEYIAEKGFFYFDRNPESFNMILDYYRNGEIHIPSGMCGALVQKELEFWKIPFSDVSECCRSSFLKAGNELETIDKIKNVLGHDCFILKEHQGSERLISRVWMFLEEPLSSTPAKIYNIVYLLIVLISIIMIFLLTSHDLRYYYTDIDTMVNVTKQHDLQIFFNLNSPKEVFFATTTLPVWWFIIDYILMGFFTLEFFLRLIVSPNKRAFFRDWLNIIDIILNLSMWARFLIEQNYIILFISEAITRIFHVLYCLVTLRLLRFLRISKQYFELQVLLLSLRDSCKELVLLFSTFILLAAFFANAIFYAEYSEPTTFMSSFSGLWWSVVTLTTVGYGEIVPKTIAGKIVGSACAICGLILLAMPIAIIASKFNKQYQTLKDMKKFQQKRKSDVVE